jgi:hypothetical protein
MKRAEHFVLTDLAYDSVVDLEPLYAAFVIALALLALVLALALALALALSSTFAFGLALALALAFAFAFGGFVEAPCVGGIVPRRSCLALVINYRLKRVSLLAYGAIDFERQI